MICITKVFNQQLGSVKTFTYCFFITYFYIIHKYYIIKIIIFSFEVDNINSDQRSTAHLHRKNSFWKMFTESLFIDFRNNWFYSYLMRSFAIRSGFSKALSNMGRYERLTRFNTSITYYVDVNIITSAIPIVRKNSNWLD